MRVETNLCREYEAWCANNKLPCMPADELSVELDYARDLTDDVRKIDRITPTAMARDLHQALGRGLARAARVTVAVGF